MGLFSTKKTGFGLDVGSSAVKLVQLQEGSKGFTLETFAMVELPPDAIGEGMIKDPPVVVDAIKEVVSKARVKTKDAVLSVSGRELIMKKIQLPKVTAKELGDAIMLEAEHHINLPIDEVYLDHQVVGQSAGQGGTMDVMLVAVKKSKINEYVAVVEEAGLTPVVVDVDAFALQNQYEMNSPETTAEAVALIDIGASIMKTNVVRGGFRSSPATSLSAGTITRERSPSGSTSPSTGPKPPRRGKRSRASAGTTSCRPSKRSPASCRWRSSAPSTISRPRPNRSGSAGSSSPGAAPSSPGSTSSSPPAGESRWRWSSRSRTSSSIQTGSPPMTSTRRAPCWPSRSGSGCDARRTSPHD